ncbi:uncharacterized protein MONBRDRAFT_13561 [Monosiga brevicollis MX1]|uniref:Uncharacterized protein n=1 Tax=Monosiga brevicollis TaxID=81824 RepID=A9UPD0_MONBE|nr:uncharacterized protein MONBRDRAFT_13561 [Monosiga brevicollis MX1]EDQ92396.1 predicted protein [Monosiga brevicollis MX1]|eukprot:XP_001742158.1 hypothetical protein [Monosiga brevicollis MX1]
MAAPPSYVTLGCLFLLIVRRRSFHYQLAREQQESPKKPDHAFGVPRHWGLFFSVGLAIVAEGIFSACYHTCPGEQVFQFDTAMMYVICAMTGLALFQRRHSDVVCRPYAFFLAMALYVFVVVLGVYIPSLWFYVVIILLAVPLSYYLVIQIYYLGHQPHDGIRGVVRPCRYCLSCGFRMHSLWPRRRRQAVIITIVLCLTWAVLFASVALNISDRPTVFLVLAILNLGAYVSYYIVNKLRHGERLTWLPASALGGSLLVWVFALYFFIWQQSSSFYYDAAGSRTLNEPCILLDVFDNHDVWHLLSAYGLFFQAVALLTLDDDLILTRRFEIHVF